MKFLIDECLSPKLATLAIKAGYAGSSHVTWIGKAGLQDWSLLPVVLAGDWTFVTKNSYDFRGSMDAPGLRGEYRKTDLHAGLICLNGPIGMDRSLQLELFQAALDALVADTDLINQVLEVTVDNHTDTDLSLQRYTLPAVQDGDNGV